MEIVSQLYKIKEFLEKYVCSQVQLKSETKIDEYEVVNPECFVFAPHDSETNNKSPFISVEFDEIIDDMTEEIYSIQLYAYIYDNGINYIDNKGERVHKSEKGQGFITLFNFISKIKRELVTRNNYIGKLLKSEIKINLIDDISPPYFGAVISFKIGGLPYPRPVGKDKDVQKYLNL